MRKLIFALACLLVFSLPSAGLAAIITVDDDGPADFHNIQDAITSSKVSDGDTIIVRPGIYSRISFNGKTVTVTSQNPNDPNTVQSTIITTSSGYSVTFSFAEGSDSVITGFTIKAVTGRGIYCYGTSPTISKNVIKNCASSGIYGELNAAPIISGNTITSNGGYGIYSCNGPITDNTISGNNGGIGSCNGPITNNIISNNRNTSMGFGGGLYDCQGEITANYIANNYASSKGGGLYSCNGDINYNVIVGNITNSEGGGLFSCQGNIGNNIIAGNVSFSGGGLSSCGGTIYNNTITGNRASYRGGAIYNCSGFVRNNILSSNEALFEGGGIYGLCQNSYNAFWANKPYGSDLGGGAVPGTGDMFANPLFAVNGYWDNHGTPSDPSDDIWIDGDYHIKSPVGRWDSASRLWVKDSPPSSPCIDAGDPNSDWTAELWPHGKRINMGAYGGTPEASMSSSPAGNVADIDNDGLVDFNDMVLLTEMWLSDQVLLAEDLNRDRIVNLVDFAILAGNWLPGPPTPNPMTWATPPYATSPYSIAMVATTATSTDWSGVEYYFEDFQHPQSNSGWLSFAPSQQPIWEDTGLTPNTEYWYRVKARNKLNLLETGWSQLASATTLLGDTTPPTPDPMTWATAPYATSPTSIRMVATTANDVSGVQYFFECTSHPAHSSTWQDSPTYEVTSLPKSVYTFVVRAQDNSPNHNTTGNSTPPVTVDLKPPTPDPMTWATLPYASSPTSIRMVATTASDDSGVKYFFECTSDPSYSSSWQDSPTYEVTSLPPASYTFVTRAQDNSPNHNTTGNSTPPVTVDLSDSNSPTPNPMQWAPGGEPKEIYGGGGTWDYYATMTAVEATDENGGIQYFFNCTTEGGFDSGWQSSRTYTVLVGRSGQGHRFRVKARDLYGNETGWSSALPTVPGY